MGYARHIGRVGALAVTLGVGVAIATAPGIAYGETAGSTTSTGDSSSTTTSSPGTAGTDGASADGAGGTDASASDPEAPSGSTGESEEGSDDPAVGDVEDAVEGGDEEAPADDEDTPPADSADDDQDSGSSGSDGQQVPHGTANAHASGLEDAAGLEDDSDSDDIDSTDLGVDGQSNQSGGQQAQTFSLTAADDAPARKSFASSSADALTMAATTFTAPAAPQQRTTLVGVVSDLVAAVLNPLLSPGNGSPFQISILTAVLSVVRNEFERVMFPRNANASSQQTVTLLSDPSTQPSLLVDPTNQHVLVIGVDGTNLSRILADDYNQNFFDLMDDGTTAASSIVGHTTISNPSWTSILTGVWGETTGVINNVFTPWTYNKFPTVFNQVETLDSEIDTYAVADWNVINAIAGAGSVPVDVNVPIEQIEGDTNWLETDDAVADATVAAISGVDAPNFILSYYVGVDENGHMYGGASPEYAAAIRNMDDNLGEIMDAVDTWEAAHPGEEWTVIMVTDHGHQPEKGFGHGFQTPDETSTFVIADGPDFGEGLVNTEYQIVDTTPTVVTLFGGTPLSNADGVPLMSLSGGDFDPDNLKLALEAEIAKNHSPDVITNVALSVRTIFAFVPQFLFDFRSGISSVPGGPIIFDALYVLTNVPAQIVARLTGVTGASIFPLLPPESPVFPPTEQEAILPESAIFA